jgi:hypothetical protein
MIGCKVNNFELLETKNFDCCDSSTMFILDNGTDQFAVHLEVMLKCIKFAEEQCKIPPLPSDWWIEIANNFDDLY